MKKIKNPFGDKGGRLLSAEVGGVTISMAPGESREVPDNVAYLAKSVYPFLEIEDAVERKPNEEPSPDFDGEKKKRRSFLNL